MFRAGCGLNDCTPELIEQKGLSIHMYVHVHLSFMSTHVSGVARSGVLGCVLFLIEHREALFGKVRDSRSAGDR